MNTTTALERRRRDWVYISTPTDLEYGPCPHCSKADYLWSTYYPFVWCVHCKDDVIPQHYGVCDGPVPIKVCQMLGMNFDALDLLTLSVVPFDSPLWPNKHLTP